MNDVFNRVILKCEIIEANLSRLSAEVIQQLSVILMYYKYRSEVWSFTWHGLCRSGTGGVGTAGWWQPSLSQASIGSYSTCRECLQAVQCIPEKAKTTPSLLFTHSSRSYLLQLSREECTCKSIHSYIHTSYLM